MTSININELPLVSTASNNDVLILNVNNTLTSALPLTQTTIMSLSRQVVFSVQSGVQLVTMASAQRIQQVASPSMVRSELTSDRRHSKSKQTLLTMKSY
jgi:hypothetical protein